MLQSPSSQRAWIEIQIFSPFDCAKRVALLAEGVDRNDFGFFEIAVDFGSPSSQRAWIEISCPACASI